MIVFRLSKEKYKNDLSGKGAEIAGGRWNSKGIPMLYTSESRALCNLEIAVHSSSENIPDDYYIITIEIPDDIKIQEIKISSLSPDWKKFPYTNSSRFLGDNFIFKKLFAVLKVPSVVVQGDFNYLINPIHEDIKRIKIINSERFEFDERLFKK